MIQIVDLLKAYEEALGTDVRLQLFSDGSGMLVEFLDGEVIFPFDDLGQLVTYMEGEIAYETEAPYDESHEVAQRVICSNTFRQS
jgi:hypothetical protein